MRFGVLGTAAIATSSVIPAIRSSEHGMTAIASRDQGRAETVAAEFGIPEAYGSYEELLSEAEVDGVYVPLPNGLHAEWIRNAADAGLHVLCEKPLTGSAVETAAVFEYCEDRGVILLEAFMYRFHPRTERALEIVGSHLGDVTSIASTCTYPVPRGSADVRLDPSLAGGSLFDVGCYGVDVVRSMLGLPDRVYARSVDARGVGVDSRLTALLAYDSGATATVTAGFDSPDAQCYRVQTTDGWLDAERAFWVDPTERVELAYGVNDRAEVERFDPVDDYRLEVEHFARCVETGVSPRIGRAESLGTARIVDALYRSAAEGRPVDLE